MTKSLNEIFRKLTIQLNCDREIRIIYRAINMLLYVVISVWKSITKRYYLSFPVLISILKKEKRNYTCTTFPLRPSSSIDRKTTFPKPIARLSPHLLLMCMYVLPVFSPSIRKRKRQEIRRVTCFQETGPLAQVHQNDRMFDPCRIPIEELAELTRSQQVVRWGLLYTVCGITVEHGGAWWRG